MSISRPSTSLKKFDVIRSDRFSGSGQLDEGILFVDKTADNSDDNYDLRRVHWFVVQESRPLENKDGVPQDATWEVMAVELINGDIQTDSEIIRFVAGGSSEERIDEVEVIGQAKVSQQADRWGNTEVKVTLALGAATSIA